MKKLLLQLTITLSLLLGLRQLNAQSFVPVVAGSYMNVQFDCPGGAFHYFLSGRIANDTLKYLWRFDGNSVAVIDSFEIVRLYRVYFMTCINDEIYIGGAFDSVNHMASFGLFKYTPATKTITKAADIFHTNVGVRKVFDIKSWNNQLLIGGMFTMGTFNTPLVVVNASSCLPFDSAIYGNGTSCLLDNIVWTIWVENNNSFYVGGSFTHINQTQVNEIAHWKNGLWENVGTGLTNDELFGIRYGGMVNQFGKLFVPHTDTTHQQTISCYDGSNWSTLSASNNAQFFMLPSSCGLFVYNNDMATYTNGLAVYNSQLNFTPVTNFYNNGIEGLFEYNNNVYVVGDFKVNNVKYSVGRIECTPVGINEQDAPLSHRAYPNPVVNQFTITVTYNTPTTVTLFSFAGQQILQQTFTNTTTINTAQLAEGIYFYELRNGSGAVNTGKLVKQ